VNDHACPEPALLADGDRGQFSGLIVKRFDYSPCDLLLRLSVRLSVQPPASAKPGLLVHGGHPREISPLFACVGTAAGQQWSWRGAFPAAPEVLAHPSVRFALRLGDWEPLELPRPGAAASPARPPERVSPVRSTRHFTMRKRAALLVVSCQLGLTPGLVGANALAAETTPGTGTEPTQEPPAPETKEPANTPAPPPAEEKPAEEPSQERAPEQPAGPEKPHEPPQPPPHEQPPTPERRTPPQAAPEGTPAAQHSPG